MGQLSCLDVNFSCSRRSCSKRRVCFHANRYESPPTIKKRISVVLHCQQKDQSWSGSGAMSEIARPQSLHGPRPAGTRIINNSENRLGASYAIIITFFFQCHHTHAYFQLHQILSIIKHMHRKMTTMTVLFCSLIKGITPKIRMLCCVLIHCVFLNLLCVWIASDTARRATNRISLAV